jgi:high-affinity iron transporter
MNLIAYAVYWGVVYLLVRRASRRPAQQATGRAA